MSLSAYFMNSGIMKRNVKTSSPMPKRHQHLPNHVAVENPHSSSALPVIGIMTRVALLWHMHQPFYQDLVTGEHILPWVRLHGSRTTGAWSRCCASFPQVRVTFNLVPSLLVQLEAFARDEARTAISSSG